MDWPDTVKAIAIFAVYLSHYVSLTGNPVLLAYLVSFNVPIFFLLGGLFFRDSDLDKSLGNIVRKKFASRILPYGVFGLATYALWLSVNYVKSVAMHHGAATLNMSKPLIGLLYGNGSWLIHNPLLWFLPCYFVTELLFFVSRRRLASIPKFIVAVLIIASAGFLYALTGLPHVPFSADAALVVLLFFTTGYFMKHVYFDVKFRGWLIVVLFLVGFLLSQANGRIDINNRLYGNVFLMYLSAICNSIAWIEISKRLAYPTTAVLYIGRNTLPLFMLQGCAGILLNAILRFVFRMQPPYLNGLPSMFLYTLSAILVILPAVYLINKYVPQVLGARRLGPVSASFAVAEPPRELLTAENRIT